MSDVPLSAQDIRAAAEVHGELGPDYQDAVVESFLAKIDKQIEARVEDRIVAMGAAGRIRRRPRRPVNEQRRSKFRLALAGAAAGTVIAGIPLTLVAGKALSQAGNGPDPLFVIWVVLLAVYGLAAFRLRRR